MNHSIRWLHLSDLHIGHPENPWINNTLQSRLKHLLQNEGELNFILITGDVIHQGKYSDSDLCHQAEQLIQMLKEQCKHIVFSIGNHDYMRDVVRMRMLADWQKLNFEEQKKQVGIYERKLRSDFETYVSFCKKISGSHSPLATQSYVYKEIPGINIVVLNTSTFSGQPSLDIEGNIQEKMVYL